MNINDFTKNSGRVIDTDKFKIGECYDIFIPEDELRFKGILYSLDEKVLRFIFFKKKSLSVLCEVPLYPSKLCKSGEEYSPLLEEDTLGKFSIIELHADYLPKKIEILPLYIKNETI